MDMNKLETAARIVESHRRAAEVMYGYPLPPEEKERQDEFAENIAVIFGFREPEYQPEPKYGMVPSWKMLLPWPVAVIVAVEILAALIALFVF